MTEQKMSKLDEELIPIRDDLGILVHETLSRTLEGGKGSREHPLSFEDRSRDLWLFERFRNMALWAKKNNHDWRHMLEFAQWLFVGRFYYHKPPAGEKWAYVECEDEICEIHQDWRMTIDRRLAPHRPAEFIALRVRQEVEAKEKPDDEL